MQLKAWEIQEWLDEQSEGIRSKLRNNMSAVFRFGRKKELIPSDCNPIEDVSVPDGTDFEAISIGDPEAVAIMTNVNEPLLKVLLVLVGMTGLRISEALALLIFPSYKLKGISPRTKGEAAKALREAAIAAGVLEHT